MIAHTEFPTPSSLFWSTCVNVEASLSDPEHRVAIERTLLEWSWKERDPKASVFKHRDDAMRLVSLAHAATNAAEFLRLNGDPCPSGGMDAEWFTCLSQSLLSRAMDAIESVIANTDRAPGSKPH